MITTQTNCHDTFPVVETAGYILKTKAKL